ncbi:MAG TPA: hypothetical protein VLM85_13910 [Polyangiaceae bacterium]|nr:hypothetical protein [Polyangiaceae bacterium]
MTKTKTLLTVASVTASLLGASPSALADGAQESSQGPAYVQGSVGVNYWDFPNIQIFGPFSTSYSWTAFRPDIEFGYHPSGRHDGFVVGVRQAFYITGVQGHAAGATVLRLGWDIPFKAGSLEINVDPFASIGAGYIFDGPHAGVAGTGGIEAKVFLTQGLYVMVRPAELGFQCLHDWGICAFSYAAGAGAGFAFGK